MRRAATVAGLSCDARKPVDTFYDDWEKIRAVLNDNGSVRASDPPEELVKANLVGYRPGGYDLPRADDDRWTTATAYQVVYQPNASPEDYIVAPGA